MKTITEKEIYAVRTCSVGLSRTEGCVCVCVDILAEAMTLLLYNPASGFAFGDGRGGGNVPESQSVL